MRFELNGAPIARGPIKIGEGDDLIVHPENILDIWSDEDLAMIGIVRLPELPQEVIVPDAIDMRQARLMLLNAPHEMGTRLDAVDAYVATQPRVVQIEWQFAKELRRDHPMVAIMAVFFNQTPEDVDQWFIDGKAIGPTTL